MPLEMSGEEHILTGTEFLDLDQLPEKIALLGGGFIAAKIAHIAARAGAQVTVFGQGERMRTAFDQDLVGWLMDKFHEIGINVRLNTRVIAIDRNNGSFSIRTSSNGNDQVFTADLVVHAAGRVPDLEPLNLAAADEDNYRQRPP